MPVGVLGLALLACRDGLTAASSATGGDQSRGRAAVAERHCGVCHEVPHVLGAHGQVGPSLERFARRTFIAGLLPNTPDNLIRWLTNPRAIEPRVAMPAVGLRDDEVRDIAAFLYTLL